MKKLFLPPIFVARKSVNTCVKFLVLVLLIISGAAAHGQTTTYTVTIPATGAAGSFTTGYVNSGTVTDGNMTCVYNATSTSNNEAFAVFNLSSIPSNAVVTSAKLTYSVTAVAGTGTATQNLYGYAGNVYSSGSGSVTSTYANCTAGEKIYYSTATGFGTATGLVTLGSNQFMQNFVQGNLGATASLVWVSTNTTRSITIAGETYATGVAPTLTIIYQTNNYTVVPLASTSFNYDLIANGTGTVTATTNAGNAFGGGYDFLSGDYRSGTNAPNGTSHFPTGGMLVSAVTTGLPYQFANYSANNTLFLNGASTVGTLTPTVPLYASKIYLLGTGSNTPTTVTVAVNYQDGTTQTFAATSNYGDWFTSGTNAMSGVGRVNNGTGSPDAYSTAAPYLHEANFALTDYTSKVASIKVTNTANQEAFFAVSAQTGSLSSSVTSLTSFGPCAPTASQVFSVTGAALYPASGTITATAPAGFQVSSNGTTWGTTAAIAISSSNLITAAPVYVRFNPSTDGAYSGNITFTGGTLNSSPSVAVTGTATGGIMVAPTTTAAFGTVTEFTPSSTITYTLSASGLAAGTVSVTSTNADFQVSPDGATWATSYTFSNTATVAGNVYIQFTPNTLSAESASINITGSAVSCPPAAINCTGMGADSCGNPSVPTSMLLTSTSTTASVRFTPTGTPDGYVIVQSSTPFAGTPTPGHVYTVGESFGGGTVIASAYTTSPTYSVTGLASNTLFYFTAIPFNGGSAGSCGGGPLYPTGTQLTSSVTTCPNVPTAVGTSGISGSAFTLSWTAPAGGTAGGTVTYSFDVSTDNTFATGVTTYTTTATTYTVTGLTGVTTYYYRILSSTPVCNSSYVTGSLTTTCGIYSLPYTQGFETITTANTLPSCMASTNLGSYTYTYLTAPGSYNRTAHTGSKFGAFHYSCNDWFFTPAVNFVSGNTYQVSFWYITDGFGGWNTLKAAYGASQTAAAMTTTVGTPLSGPTNTTYAQYTGTFVATSTGTNYVGVYCTASSVPWYLSIDDISIQLLPSLNASPSSVNAGKVNVGYSGVSTYSLSGTGLTGSGNITITAPASYQVSTTSGSGFATSITVPYTSGALSSTAIYVQFSPTVTGTISGSVTCTGGGAALNVPVTGIGVVPILAVSPSSLNMGPTLVGVAAPTQSFSVSGSYLLGYPGNITLTSSNTDYLLSTDGGSTWSSSVMVPFATATLTATSISVQYTASSAGASTSTVSLSGGGASSTPTETLTGSGTPPCGTPAGVPTSMVFSGTTSSATTVGFTTSGTPDGYLLVKSLATLTSSPVNTHNYNVGDTMGGGTVAGVYTSAPTYTISGLSGNTNYYFTVVPFNGGTMGTCGTGPLYGTALTNTVTTCPTVPSLGTASATITGITINWGSVASGGALPVTYSVGVYTNSAYTGPVTGSPFTLSDPTTSLTVSGLTSGTTYYYKVNAATSSCTSAYATGSKAAATYCTPSFSGGTGSCSGYYTSSVVLGGTTWTGASGTCGTSNYTSQVFTVTAGVSSSIAIGTVGYCGTAAWIDYTNDGTFNDAGEGVFLPSYSGASAPTYTGGVTVPTTIATGTYRMRVLTNWATAWNGWTPGASQGPCSAYSTSGYGCFQDFSVLVLNSSLTTSINSVSFGNVPTCSTSGTTTVTVTGTGLYPASGNIIATAPAGGFQISSDGVSWGTTATYPYTGNRLSATNMYIRYTSTVVGTYSGNITFSGGSPAAAPTVSVSATAAGTTLVPATAAFFGPVSVSTISPAQTYTLTGSNLTPGTITVATSNPDFQVSPDGSTYSPAGYSFSAGSTLAATSIYVVYSPTVVGTETATITVTSPTGCVQTFTASGNGADSCSAPGTPTGISFTGTNSTGTGITFTPSGSPDGYLVLQGSTAFAGTPTTGTNYSVGSSIGTSTVVGVFTVTTVPLTITSASGAPIMPNTAYNITVIPFNGGPTGTCTGGPVYASAYLAGTYTTCPALPTAIITSSVTGSGFTVGWTGSAGTAETITYYVDVSTDNTFATGVSTYTTTGTTQPVTVAYGSTVYYYRLHSATSTCNSAYSATGSVTTSCGITPLPYTESFESITTANTLPSCMAATNLGGANKTYLAATGTYNQTAHTGSKYASFYYLNSSGGYCNDWFFTPQFNFIAGYNYQVSFWYVTDGLSGWLTLKAGYGAAQTAAGMTSTVGTPLTNVTNTTYAQYTGTFTATSTGNDYVGIYCNSNVTPYYLTIDDISVKVLPSLVASPAAVTVGSVNVGYSGVSSYSLTGTGLTGSGNITITAPASYLVSTTSGSGFASSITVPYTSGVLSSTAIYVQFSPTVTGTVSGTIACSGGGASVNIPVSGVGVLQTLVVSPSTLNMGPTLVGSAAPVQTFSVSGSFLTGYPGNITLTSTNTDYQISTDGSTWYSSVTVPYTTATLTPTTISVQYTASTIGASTGSITMSGGGVATTPTVTLTGSGSNPCSTPSGAPSGMVFTGTNATSTTVGFTTSGTVDGYLLVQSSIPLTTTPTNMHNYNVGDTLGGGTVAGVYSTGPTYPVTGLTGNTQYYFTVIPFNGGVMGTCGTGPRYGTSLAGLVNTCPATPGSPSASASSSGMVINWSSSLGGAAASSLSYTIDVSTNNTFTAPVSGSPFTVTDPTTSITVGGLATASVYYYRITAVGAGTCSSPATATGNVTTTTYNYNTITVSGFNEDVIANGSANPANGALGVAGTSTGSYSGFDNANYAFISSDYSYGGHTPVSGQSLPISGTLTGTLSPAPTYQLAGYSTNNALVLANSSGNASTLTFATPQYANQLFFLGTSGSGLANCTFTLNYADGTSSTSASLLYPDWYTGGSTVATLATLGRVNVTTGSPDGSSTTGPYFYQQGIAPTNYNSKVTSVVVTTQSGTTGYLGIFAVSARTGALYPSVTSLPNFGSATVCSGSTAQSFTISGSSLFPATTGTVAATASAGFQVSTNGTTWGSTAIYTVSGTSTIATSNVYVRFLPVTGGATTGTITFVGAGINNGPSVSVSGTGVTGTITGTTTVCQNATITLSNIVTGGTWSSASPLVATVASTTGVVTGVTSGTAVISYTYGCGTTVNTATVTVNPTPTTTGPTYGPLCTGGTLALASNATGATTYSWLGAATLSSSTVANPTSAGTVTAAANGVYTVTLGNTYGCSLTATTPTVSVSAQPSATVTPSGVNLCTGSVETLTSAVTGGAGIPTYTWSGPGMTGTTATSASTYSLTPSAGSGSYSLAVSYSVSTGCNVAAATTATVNIAAPPSISAVSPSVTNLCSGTTFTLTATEAGGSGSPVYTWKGPGMSTTTTSTASLALTPTVTTATSGTYSVTVNFGGTGCGTSAVTTSSVVAINAQPAVSLSASPLSLCAGSNLTLTTVSTGGSGTATYTWSGPGIATATGSTAGASIYTPTVSTGSYSVSVSYTGSGCNVVAGTSSVVAVNPQPTATVTPSSTTLCVGTTEILTAATTGGSGTPTYTWSGPGISGSAGPYAASTYTVAPASGTAAGAYSVVVAYSVTGCNTATNSTAIVTPTDQQWIGATSANWSDATNWACGAVPTATEDVVIPGASTYTNAPMLDVATGYTHKLTINTTAILTLGTGKQMDVTGNLVNNGTVNGGGGLYLNGTSAQVLTGNGFISNLGLGNSAGASIGTTSDTVGITGTLLLNSGTFTTGGTLMLVSNSDGNGSIGTITGGALSGSVIVQQYIPSGRRAYRFIAHPFSTSIPLSQIEPYIDITGSGGSTNGFTTTTSNAPSAYWYNPVYGNSSVGSDPGWRAFTSADGTPDSNNVHRYEGLRLFFRGAKGEGLSGASYTIDAATYRTYGTVNTGSLSMPMVKGGTNGDYNLLGNPYPAVTDIGTVIHNASTSGLVTGGAFYVWNPYMGTSGQFITETIGSSYYMGANESFEVRTAANGNVLTFSESNKGTTPTNALMRNASNDYVTLYVYDSSYHPWDVLNVKFDDAATDNEDAKYDGAKPPSPASLNFYSWSADNSKLALDVRPFEADKVIILGITSSYTQDFIIKAENVALPAGGQIYLHDKYLQTFTQLHQGTEYKFTISKDAASQGDQRFELKTSPAGSKATAATSLDVQMVPNPATSDVTIHYTATGKEQTSIRVLNVEGVTVLSQDLGLQQSGSVKLAVDKLAAGVYMVELTSGATKVVHRLVKE